MAQSNPILLLSSREDGHGNTLYQVETNTVTAAFLSLADAKEYAGKVLLNGSVQLSPSEAVRQIRKHPGSRLNYSQEKIDFALSVLSTKHLTVRQLEQEAKKSSVPSIRSAKLGTWSGLVSRLYTAKKLTIAGTPTRGRGFLYSKASR